MAPEEIKKMRKKLEMLKMHLDYLEMLSAQVMNIIYEIEEKIFDIEDDNLNKKING